jgi:undecaprenyl-diphosphatase
VLLAVLAWLGVFAGLLQIDFRLERFERSLHLLWLEQVGDVGGRLGSGLVVAAISGTLLAIGYKWSRADFRLAGLQGLIAQAVAGGIAEILKRLIGRPRPRMLHGDDFTLGPSLFSGLESFPSGHASIAFAVAAVVARHFPRASGLAYGLACVVAVSRIIRGSHYPTDVMAGVTLGIVVGRVVANPLPQWAQSALSAFLEIVPYLVGVFGIAWAAMHAVQDARQDSVMSGVGALLIAAGLWRRTSLPHPPDPRLAWSLMGIGIALLTGSLLVTSLAVVASASRWLAATAEGAGPCPSPTRAALVLESAAVIGAAVAIHALKGVLPIL